MTPRRDVDRAHRVADERHEQVRRARRARPRAPRTTGSATQPRARGRPRASPSTTRQPSRSSAYHSSSPSGGAAAARHEQLGAAQRLGRLAAVDAGQAQDRALVGAGAAHDLAPRASPTRTAAPSASSARARARDVEGAVEPVGPADAAGRRASRRAAAPRQSTMSTSTRRFSLTAAAFTTVRSALAVRPPRPMILP